MRNENHSQASPPKPFLFIETLKEGEPVMLMPTSLRMQGARREREMPRADRHHYQSRCGLWSALLAPIKALLDNPL